MKIWLTGASGLLGRALSEALQSSGHEIVKLAYSRASGNRRKLDLTDPMAVSAAFGEDQPDIVVFSAAERHPDACENDPAGTHAINVAAAGHLAGLCRQTGSWMLYFSTDYVFDGTTPPYHTDDPVNPINTYGKSKAEGEAAVLQANPACAVLRVPILYGPVEFIDESAVTIIAGNLKEATGPVSMENTCTRYPTLTTDVAAVVAEMVNRYVTEPKAMQGIFHWSGREAFTKYEMACIMAEILGIDPATILPDNNPVQTAPRPKDCTLDCSRLHNLGIGLQASPFQPAIAGILKSAI